MNPPRSHAAMRDDKTSRNFGDFVDEMQGDDDMVVPQNRKRHWRIDRTISIALILGFMVESASFIWSTSRRDYQLDVNTAAIAELKTDSKDNQNSRTQIISHLSSIDTSIGDIRELLMRSKAK